MTATKSLNPWPGIRQVDPTIYSPKISWPKISIVTPSLNQGQFIEETILSVLNQNYPNLEYIIIDGGSTDDTVEIIKRYSDRITYWVSEKDSGQSEAIVKGFKRCTGDLFNWINSDDLLAERALFTLSEEYNRTPQVKVIAGGCISFTDRLPTQHRYNKQDLTFKGLISEKSNFQQPSQWIVLRNAAIKINTNFHYSFDWDMILNLDLEEGEIKYIPNSLSYFRNHSESKTANCDSEFKREKIESVKLFSRERKKHKWSIFKYQLLLEAYLHAIERRKNLLILLIKKPLFLFSRFYVSTLMRSFFK